MKPNMNNLIELREGMIYAEVVHLIGFAYVIVRIVVNIINDEHHSMIVPLFTMNIIMNFYPVLVQQLNKRRIDRLLKALESRQVGSRASTPSPT